MNRVTFRHDCCWKPHESSIVFPIVLLANWTAYSRRSKTLTAILLILATSIVPVFSQVVPPRLEKAGTVAHLGDESHKGVAGTCMARNPITDCYFRHILHSTRNETRTTLRLFKECRSPIHRLAGSWRSLMNKCAIQDSLK